MALLQELPTVNKSMVVGGLPPIVGDDDLVAVIGYTSGTTGDPHMWLRTATEVEAIAQLHPRAGRPPTGSALGIRVYPPFHGLPSERYKAGDPVYYLEGSLQSDLFAKRTIWMLKAKYEISGFEDRVTVLQMPAWCVVTLTQALIDSGIAATDLRVGRIQTFGGYPNAVHRRFIRDFWQLDVTDIYSSSEISGPCPVCKKCGFTLFAPHMIPEALELESDHVLEKGMGRLVITALYPYRLAQPLVRYDGGDVCEIIEETTACSSAHVGGLRVRGRRAASIFLKQNEKTELMVGSHTLQDVFFDAAVDKMDPFSGSLSISDRRYIGAPLVSYPRIVSDGQLTIRFKRSPGARDDTGIFLRERLLSSSKELSSALFRGAISLEVIADDAVNSMLSK